MLPYCDPGHADCTHFCWLSNYITDLRTTIVLLLIWKYTYPLKISIPLYLLHILASPTICTVIKNSEPDPKPIKVNRCLSIGFSKFWVSLQGNNWRLEVNPILTRFWRPFTRKPPTDFHGSHTDILEFRLTRSCKCHFTLIYWQFIHFIPTVGNWHIYLQIMEAIYNKVNNSKKDWDFHIGYYPFHALVKMLPTTVINTGIGGLECTQHYPLSLSQVYRKPLTWYDVRCVSSWSVAAALGDPANQRGEWGRMQLQPIH